MSTPSSKAHSKFSASGAERWINCSGSVKLSEGVPDKSSVWAKEGTLAHEVLEYFLMETLKRKLFEVPKKLDAFSKFKNVTVDMAYHARNSANFILSLHKERRKSKVMIENKIDLKFIHPEMFGTLDSAVVEEGNILQVLDFKYGQGHAVSVKQNLQMIFYGMGLAHFFKWNFKKIRLWIIQPRIKSYDGPVFEELSIEELKSHIPIFKNGVERALKKPDLFKEGTWCRWCKAENICPLKKEKKMQKAISVFDDV